MTDPTAMYADRVDWYVRGRPEYPGTLFGVLPGGGLPAGWTVADVASGTGLLSAPALDNGNRVYGVEPNPAMRAAAERRFTGEPRFTSVDGTAERTGLADASVDLVTVGQALHWFDLASARAEFARILRPGGSVLLAWNERSAAGSPVQDGVEALLRAEVAGYAAAADAATGVVELATAFFGREPLRQVLPNRQLLDQEALLGRVLSNSYAPARTDPAWARLVEGLLLLHTRHAEDGYVRIDYDTWVFLGAPEGAGDDRD